MLQDLSSLNYISKYQIEFLTLLLLALGQRFIRQKYSFQDKYDQKVYQTTQENFDNQDEFIDTEQDNFSEIQNTQSIRIMNKFVKLGKIDLAEQVFKKLKNPCLQSYTIMIKGYSKINQLEKSTEIIKTMKEQGMQPSIITYNTYLTCSLKCKNQEIAEKLMIEIKDKDVITYSTYIRGLLKLNKIDQAIQAHDNILKQKNIILDEMYFNVLINGLVKTKQIKKAIVIYNQMKQQNFDFNDFSVSVITQLFSKFDQTQIYTYFKEFQKNDVLLLSRVINQMIREPQTIMIGCEFIKKTMNSNIVLNKSVYEKTIEILYQVITHQIIREGLSVKFAQDTQFQIVQYSQINKILLNNKYIQDISVISCNQFYKTPSQQISDYINER